MQTDAGLQHAELTQALENKKVIVGLYNTGRSAYTSENLGLPLKAVGLHLIPWAVEKKKIKIFINEWLEKT